MAQRGMTCIKLILLLSVFKTCTGACSYPSPWLNKLWHRHYDSFTSTEIWFYKFLPTGRTEQGVDGSSFKILYECTSSNESIPDQRFYVRHLQLAPSHIQCQKLVSGTNVILERLTKIDTAAPASECWDKEDKDGNFVAILQSPVENNTISCPFSDGQYQLQVADTDPNVMSCTGDGTSVATVSGSDMTISSCLTGQGYDEPYNVKLKCLGSVSEDLVSDQAGSGDVLVLSTEINGLPRQYCARYKIDGAKVYLSLCVSDDKTTYCAANVNYTAAGNVEALTYRAFQLTAITPTTTPAATTAASTTKGMTTLEETKTTNPAATGTTSSNNQQTTGVANSSPGAASSSSSAAETTETTPSGGGGGTTSSACIGFVCQNGATCIIRQGGASCLCPAGFTGNRCESVLPTGRCSEEKCHTNNTISCKDSQPLGYYYCRCRGAFKGMNCEALVDACGSSPCQHGGICTNLDPGYRCNCPVGYKGDQCESENTATGQGLSNDMLILIALVLSLAGVIFIALVVAVLACHRNRKRQEKARPITSMMESPIISNMEGDRSGYSSIRSWYPLYRAQNGGSDGSMSR